MVYNEGKILAIGVLDSPLPSMKVWGFLHCSECLTFLVEAWLLYHLIIATF